MAYLQTYRAKVKLYQRLKSRGDAFHAQILCRDFLSRAVFWGSVFLYVIVTVWIFLSEHFHDVPKLKIAGLMSLSFLPIFLLGLCAAFPDRQLYADQFMDRVELRLRFCGRILWRIRLRMADCARVEMVLVTKDPIERRKRDFFYSLYRVFTSPLNYIVQLFRFLRKESENNPHFGIQFTMKDGKAHLTHITRNEKECKEAVLALKTVFPRLVREPAPEPASQKTIS